MCGRFARWTSRRDFAALAGLQIGGAHVGETVPSWNITPGRACAVVRRELGRQTAIDQILWGLVPHWIESPPPRRPVNARIESVAENRYFRRCFKYRRALVAADGWYEWTDTPAGKEPWFHRLADAQPMFFGGVWDEWRDAEGKSIVTFAILTQPAVPAIAAIHDRMPVVLRPEAYEAWLDKDVTDAAAVRALSPPRQDVVAYRVSRRVNRSDTDGPDLVEPDCDS